MIKFIYYGPHGELEFSRETGYMIYPESLASVTAQFTEASTSHQVGTTITDTKVDPKDMTLNGEYIYSPLRRRALIDVILPGETAQLRYINDDAGLDVFLEGQPSSTPDISNGPHLQFFQFVFRAPYPYWQSWQNAETSFNAFLPSFQFPVTFSGTSYYISTRSVAPLKQVVNAGSAECGFTIVLKAETGTVTSPEVLNVATQEHLKFTGLVLQAGDWIEISTHEEHKSCKICQSGVTSNAYPLLDDDSVFFRLAKGANTIRAGAVANEENLAAVISCKTVYVGV